MATGEDWGHLLQAGSRGPQVTLTLAMCVKTPMCLTAEVKRSQRWTLVPCVTITIRGVYLLPEQPRVDVRLCVGSLRFWNSSES